jgi:hypothetical protein
MKDCIDQIDEQIAIMAEDGSGVSLVEAATNCLRQHVAGELPGMREEVLGRAGACIARGCPGAWVLGTLVIVTAPRAPAWPEGRWRALQADCVDFCEGWGGEAAMMGWQAWEIFGCHPKKTWARVDCLGIVCLLNSSKVVDMTATTATIRSKAGGITTYRKIEQITAVQKLAVPIWETLI